MAGLKMTPLVPIHGNIFEDYRRYMKRNKRSPPSGRGIQWIYVLL